MKQTNPEELKKFVLDTYDKDVTDVLNFNMDVCKDYKEKYPKSKNITEIQLSTLFKRMERVLLFLIGMMMNYLI